MALPRLFYRTAGRGLCLTKSRLTSSQDIQLVLELYYTKWKYCSLLLSSPNNINIFCFAEFDLFIEYNIMFGVLSPGPWRYITTLTSWLPPSRIVVRVPHLMIFILQGMISLACFVPCLLVLSNNHRSSGMFYPNITLPQIGPNISKATQPEPQSHPTAIFPDLEK